MKDLYYILGTDRNCTPRELNAAYQKLARKLQPDEREHDYFLEDHFKEITEAYQVLSDPDQRRKYDAAFKKNYQRRLYYFKIRHLNIVATIALLLFTGLFGWYVMKMLGSSNKQKKVAALAPVAQAPVITSPPGFHHKKKHKVKLEAPLINQLAVLAKDTVIHHSIKPAPIIASKPTVIQQDTIQNESSSNYSIYLQANATGVIYLHELPNYTSAVISKIPDHSKVTVVEKGRQFYKVVYNDQTGYVPKWKVADP
ncbi:DnaJ domain-containing protein [Mucilaginibacter sp. BT774]|uniref:DnaJ domain-containing protein n=1 Tax=Mucilaginibacter sp. BT774 TaxID=3062276 RepID=UPI002674CD18|nr:DnaJ domain-containing protein [Mucilaginibacter sp. BT774]MDO3627664.1 DnaJ domain-containing protein [Mucilaginibacter sp. BT774]